MSRPRKKTKKVPVNIVFDPEFLVHARAFSFETGESISEMAERLIRDEIARTGLADSRRKPPDKSQRHAG